MHNFFENCKTEPQVKREYRKLSHKHHPDKPGGDKEIFQEILKQHTAALRRIAVSEGKAESYYEELAAKVGKKDFASSILSAALKIDKQLDDQGVDTTDFNSVFKAVSELFYSPKKEIEKKQDPKQLPGT
ncbi:MAG: hypothetical protein V4721_16510 [Bacteroidota bacterium]